MSNGAVHIKSMFPRIWNVFHNLRERYYAFLGKHYPVKLIRVWHRHLFHEDIDLDNPRTINEKINWMKLHSDMSLWTRCADKFEVRKYVEECGLGSVLNTIYGVFDRADEIDFSSLPQSFVLKTTNGGGGKSVLIVKDKSALDIRHTIRQLNKWLRQEVAYRYYEPHYLGIKPRIIAEKYLEPDGNEKSLTDYKVNCFDGRAYSILVCSDRNLGGSACLSVYDPDWKPYPQETVKPQYRTDKVHSRPRSLDKMLEYSRILSKGIPYVRVDWYEIDGEPVFSEMTFTPGGGFMHKYSKEYLLELGNQMKLE